MGKYTKTICLIFMFASTALAGEFGSNDVNTVLEKADKLKSEIQLEKTVTPEAQKAAEKAAEYFQSEECQNRIKKESSRLKKEVFREYVKQQPGPEGLPATERIYIFISSSVPVPTLKAYAVQIDAIGDPNIVMVLRGFVGGIKKFEPTMTFCRKVLMFDPDCKANDCDAFRAQIQIDPDLFRQFGITEVPAFVYAQNINLIDPDQSAGLQENNRSQISGYVLYGAVPIDYALDKFYQETRSKNLKAMLSKIRGSRK